MGSSIGSSSDAPFAYDYRSSDVWQDDPSPRSLVHRFATIVEQFRDRPAVVERNGDVFREVTYGELDEHARRIASHLVATRGPGPARAAVLVHQDSEHLAALLGTLMAGYTAVPLHKANPPARQQYIVDHAQASVVIVDDASAVDAQSLWSEEVMTVSEASAASIPPGGVSPDRDTVAMILYTSGSTGHPKGVVQSHGYLLDKTRSDTAFHRYSARDRLSQLFPLSFAASTTNTYGALLNGAALCPYDVSSHGIHHLADWIEASGLTGLSSVPTLFRRALSPEMSESDFSAVRYVSLGGELVLRADVELHRQLFPDETVLIHRLAMTEAGVIARFVIRHDTDLPGAVVPAGFPAPDKELLIVDEHGAEVADGEVGELWVRGATLSDGFWRDDELNAGMHVGDEPEGIRTLRTGDLAMRANGGHIVHSGRKDSRIKIRGNAVDLLEVERTLVSLPGVTEGAVKVFTGDDEPRLAGYYAGDLDVQEMRRLFRESVPEYMVPPDLVRLDVLPLTGRGKIDRNALLQPEQAQSSGPYVAPATDTEHKLASLWAAIFEVENVSVEDSFFDLGGSSIQAYELVSLIYRDLELDIPASSLLERGTIRAQAALLDSGEELSARSLVPLRTEGTKRPLFGVHGIGGGIIFLHKLTPLLDGDRPVYGLQPPMQAGVAPGYQSIEDIAADYLAEVKTVQPSGPYRLVGSCFGGLVAREMARRLEDEGEVVSPLVIIDPPTQGYHDPTSWRQNRRSFTYIRRKARYRLRQVLLWPRRLMRRFRSTGNEERTDQLSALHVQARSAYQPQQSGVPLVVFASRGQEARQRWFWTDVSAGGLEIEEMKANHTDMWTPWHRKVIATMLERRLEDHETGTPSVRPRSP